LEPSDDDVVARAKRGDEAAWRDLYGTHAGRLECWLRSRPCADAAADVDDVGAEAWLTAAQRIADFTGDTGDFGGWLFQIARMVSNNTHRRSERRATSPVAVDDSAIWGEAADVSVLVDGADWTRRLVATLPSREAEVILCLDVVGLDVAATSMALGISATAVRVSHHRGLRRLRRRLSGSEPDARRGSRSPDAMSRSGGSGARNTATS
jgi:RNA polymerase sigma-70 factor, ECF subfamily